MGITPPMTWRLMRFCLRKPPAAGRSGCNGRAKTRCRMRHSGRRWRSRSKPILTPKARSSNGDTASGAMATLRGPDARHSLLCSRRPNSQIRSRATSPPIRHRPMAVAPIATPYRSTIFHRGKLSIRTSALRTLGGQGNVFAIESFAEELATERGEDPVAFRLRHLSDSRAQDVIRSVARRSNWKPVKQTGRGYGLGFARYKNTGAYCAVVAEIEGAEDVSVKRLTVAVDVGEAINPDGVINQIEGGAIQA